MLSCSKCNGSACRRHAARYEAEFLEDLVRLNCRMPHVLTRVSEYMDEIREYVQQIFEKGFAYCAEGDIYFDTQAYRCDALGITPRGGPQKISLCGLYFIGQVVCLRDASCPNLELLSDHDKKASDCNAETCGVQGKGPHIRETGPPGHQLSSSRRW